MRKLNDSSALEEFFPGFQGSADCALLKESKSKKILLCPGNSAAADKFYLIKIYFYPGLFQTVKYLFRKSKSRKELALASAIRKKGIPAIVPEQIRDIKKWGVLRESAVLTEQIPDCLNLEELLLKKKVFDRRLRKRILEEYGKLAGLIHDQGVYQDDFDPNNILYQKKQDDTFRLYFVDFERTRVVRKISFKKRVHSLAKLNRMGRNLKKTDQLRFLKAYLGPSASRKERRKWLTGIIEEEEKVLRRDQRRARGKCTSASDRIGLIQYRGYQGFYRKKHHSRKYYDQSDIIRLIEAIEKSYPDDNLRQHPMDRFVDLTLPSDSGKETFQIRFFEYGGIKQRLQRHINRSPLLEAWKTDNGYLKNRSADFLPVAALEKKTASNCYQGYLIRRH